MKSLDWLVQFTEPLYAVRFCKKCGEKKYFIPSGAFRINSNQHYSDIWMIYKCIECDCTWNLTLFTRIDVRKMDAELYSRFQNNDQMLIDEYSMNEDIVKKNAGQIELTEYEVLGEELSATETIEIYLHAMYPTSLKIRSVICKKLGISRSQLGNLISKGALIGKRVLAGTEEIDLLKARINDGVYITFFPERLEGKELALLFGERKNAQTYSVE